MWVCVGGDGCGCIAYEVNFVKFGERYRGVFG